MSRALSVDISGLAAEDDFGLAARRVIGLRLVECALYLPACLRAPEMTPVHDLRVALRRLRAALNLFAPRLAAAQREAIKQTLAELGRSLGIVREIDVHRELLRKLDGDSPVPELERFEMHFAADRDAALPPLQTALESARRHDFPLLMGIVATIRRGQDLRARAKKRIAKRMDEVQVTLAATSDQSVESLHTLRIALKKLRYALEIVDPIVTGEHGRRDALAELQERLGKLHDLDTLYAALQHWGAAPSLLDRLLVKRVRELEKIAAPLAALPALLTPDRGEQKEEVIAVAALVVETAKTE